jgi:hypothetical protein
MTAAATSLTSEHARPVRFTDGTRDDRRHRGLGKKLLPRHHQHDVNEETRNKMSTKPLEQIEIAELAKSLRLSILCQFPAC